MRLVSRRLLVIAVVAVAFMSLAAQPAAACERCLFSFVCENYDNCYVILFCGNKGPPIAHLENCQVFPWGCQEWGDSCFWA